MTPSVHILGSGKSPIETNVSDHGLVMNESSEQKFYRRGKSILDFLLFYLTG